MTVGSKAEMVLLSALIALTAAFYPLSHIGCRDALQALLLLKNFDISVEQYERQIGTHRLCEKPLLPSPVAALACYCAARPQNLRDQRRTAPDSHFPIDLLKVILDRLFTEVKLAVGDIAIGKSVQHMGSDSALTRRQTVMLQPSEKLGPWVERSQQNNDRPLDLSHRRRPAFQQTLAGLRVLKRIRCGRDRFSPGKRGQQTRRREWHPADPIALRCKVEDARPLWRQGGEYGCGRGAAEEAAGRAIEVDRALAHKRQDADLLPLRRIARQSSQEDGAGQVRDDAVDQRHFVPAEIALAALPMHTEDGEGLSSGSSDDSDCVVVGYVVHELTEFAARKIDGVGRIRETHGLVQEDEMGGGVHKGIQWSIVRQIVAHGCGIAIKAQSRL